MPYHGPVGDFVIVCAGWVFSLCLHEWGHAIVAYRGGDTGVREKGYLSFNPLAYAHPVMSLLLPLLFLLGGGIALPGGAVYIDRTRLRTRAWESAVSLAGPLANLLMGIACSLPFLFAELPEDPAGTAWPALALLANLQFASFFMNLLPLPPLDGYGTVAPWLPRSLREPLDRAGMFGLFIVYAALGPASPLHHAYWDAVYALGDLFRIPSDYVHTGWISFRFWDR
jgi:Zn-dependent protease